MEMTRTQVKTPRIAEEEDLGNFPGWGYPKINRRLEISRSGRGNRLYFLHGGNH
jgi:hypothetical protein